MSFQRWRNATARALAGEARVPGAAVLRDLYERGTSPAGAAAWIVKHERRGNAFVRRENPLGAVVGTVVGVIAGVALGVPIADWIAIKTAPPNAPGAETVIGGMFWGTVVGGVLGGIVGYRIGS